MRFCFLKKNLNKMWFLNWVFKMSFSCSDPQVILARVKVNICGRVQVDRQRKASTCLGRAQAFVSGLFNWRAEDCKKIWKAIQQRKHRWLAKTKTKKQNKASWNCIIRLNSRSLWLYIVSLIWIVGLLNPFWKFCCSKREGPRFPY